MLIMLVTSTTMPLVMGVRPVFGARLVTRVILVFGAPLVSGAILVIGAALVSGATRIRGNSHLVSGAILVIGSGSGGPGAYDFCCLGVSCFGSA